jgi:hypothetical protein
MHFSWRIYIHTPSKTKSHDGQHHPVCVLKEVSNHHNPPFNLFLEVVGFVYADLV